VQFEVIDLELDLLLRRSRLENFLGGVMRLGLMTSGYVISFHDTIYQAVMYCGVFLVNGFPQ